MVKVVHMCVLAACIVIGGLSNEVIQKLDTMKPETLGSASRIQGVTPAAISQILVHMKKLKLARKSA